MTVRSDTVTVLFADICDSTRLYHQLGDGDAHRLAMNCLKVVSHATSRNGGKIVKNIGDGAMITFGSVEQAYRAAAHIQHAMRCAPLKVKVGFHVGPVIIADGDVFGNTVNLAERTMARSGPGEILMTRACVDTLSPMQRATVRLLDAPLVEGDPATELYRVISESAGETTVIPPSAAKKNLQRVLVLSYRGDVFRMSAGDSSLVIGRETGCRIVIQNDCTSRHHASIQIEGNGFVLTDRSTNGTYVIDAKGNERFLRRESAQLSGNGSISIGIAPGKNAAGLIQFRSEEIAAGKAEAKPVKARTKEMSLNGSAIFTAKVGAAHAAHQFQSWTS